MPIMTIKGITKTFGSLLANDNISLSLEKGEVLSLLGENGAGKTTLMNILFGHYTADSGSIEVAGKQLPPGATNAAIQAGVGMVHQHFTLAENMTVLENIILGTEPLWSWHSDTTTAKQRMAGMANDFGLEIDPDQLVAEISLGERQRVEILKALYRNAKILILDEPTAVLTPQGVDQLFSTLKAMVNKGLSVIFISHKLHEILRIADRVSVLRRGKIVGEIATKDADREILAEMMVGRKVHRPQAERIAPGKPVIELRNVLIKGSPGQRPQLKNISLTISQNQIVGLAGVSGNGQSVLAQLLSGLSVPDEGTFLFCGEEVKKFSAHDFIQMGIGRVPEDRHLQGVVGEMSVWENLISEDLRKPPFWRYGFMIDFKACRAFANKLIEQFDIRCKGVDTPVKLLSGGNMQKAILAATLKQNPKFIIANQPVRGLDEGAIAAVHERLLAAKRQGAGILLISEDLDELLALSDKIVVFYHGEASPLLSVDAITFRDIGLMMAGDLNHFTPA